MVLNATFNNISVKISWRSVLLLEETGVYDHDHDGPNIYTILVY
jgi:hypothetical protein